MSRMPSDSEITVAGETLGLGPGPYSTKVRAQLAKTIQEAAKMGASARMAESTSETFAARMAVISADLRRHSFSATGAEEIAAAIAPTIYRETKENTAP